MPAAGCCLWPCCGRTPTGDVPSPVLPTKTAVVSNGTELRNLPPSHNGSGARELPVKQVETSLSKILPSNGHQVRVAREPQAFSGRIQTERLMKSAAPAPTVADVTPSAAVAAEEATAIELPPVDPIISQRLDKLRDQDPLDVVNDTRTVDYLCLCCDIEGSGTTGEGRGYHCR